MRKRRWEKSVVWRIHLPLGFHLIVLYGPSPRSRSGLHFLSNTVALAGITEVRLKNNINKKQSSFLRVIHRHFTSLQLSDVSRSTVPKKTPLALEINWSNTHLIFLELLLWETVSRWDDLKQEVHFPYYVLDGLFNPCIRRVSRWDRLIQQFEII